MERCLKITCYSCGDESYVFGEQVDTQQDYKCPGCGRLMDRNYWRKQKQLFYLMEDLVRQASAAFEPVCEVRLFDSEYIGYHGESVDIDVRISHRKKE